MRIWKYKEFLFLPNQLATFFAFFKFSLQKAKVALDDTGTITKYVMYFSSFLQAWRGSLLTVWSLWKFCITWKLFREINFIVKVLTKEVVFTEIFQKIVIQKFRKLHSVHHTVWSFTNFCLTLFLRKLWGFFREIEA